jgi:hypothetical protein
MDDAVQWVLARPERFKHLTSRRIFKFWFPSYRHYGVYAWSHWLLTAFAGIGLGILAVRSHWAAHLFGWVLLLYPLIYYVNQGKIRFRYPVLWVLLLLSGYVAIRVLDTRRAARSADSMERYPQ